MAKKHILVADAVFHVLIRPLVKVDCAGAHKFLFIFRILKEEERQRFFHDAQRGGRAFNSL